MKINRIYVKNFNSYEELDLEYPKDLTLVSGQTGSGKSTLLDMSFWVIYGETAKGGTVDSVKSWFSEDKETVGAAEIETSTGVVIITRIRGVKNDLYYQKERVEAEMHRGTDLKDTQKRINSLLGADSALYRTACYLDEFSPTSLFFMSSARERRSVLERIANLELPNKIAKASSEAVKACRQAWVELQKKLQAILGRLNGLETSKTITSNLSKQWEKDHTTTLERVKALADTFDSNKQAKVVKLKEAIAKWEEDKLIAIKTDKLKSEELSIKIINLNNEIDGLKAKHTCEKCGSLCQDDQDHIFDLINVLGNLKTQLRSVYMTIRANEEASHCSEHGQLASVEAQTNGHQARLEDLQSTINPYLEQINTITGHINKAQDEGVALRDESAQVKIKIDRLDRIYDLSGELRGILLTQTVESIKNATNKYLEKHFDGIFRVDFSLQADKLDTTITKDGHMCEYGQLSKGQRGILRLCFTLSVMQAASEQSGSHFDNLMFDEPLEGLDETLKIKAFDILQELSLNHSSVLVIDHCEAFKGMFESRINVSISEDKSYLEYQ